MTKNHEIYNIFVNKEQFENDVKKQTINDILKIDKQNDKFLRSKIIQSLTNETDILNKRSKFHDDNKKFWKNVFEELNNDSIPLNDIVEKIIVFYIHEISAKFNTNRYKSIKLLSYYLVNKLTNPLKFGLPNNLSTIKEQFIKCLDLYGDIDFIKSLFNKGTVIFVPNHNSNLDAPLLGLIFNYFNTPPILFGASIGLFDNAFFAFCMDKIGVYKIDRSKKDIIYLYTIKNYVTNLLHYGCHSLFFPEGTRSRSGEISKDLKLGILKTLIIAQNMNYKKYLMDGKKIFVIPINFNYHFILESRSFINEYIHNTYKITVNGEKKMLISTLNILKFLNKIITKHGRIGVTIGEPMDVFGNDINTNFDSIDGKGNIVDIYKVFYNKDFILTHQDINASTLYLAKKIHKQYKKHNRVITSNLLAFVMFELYRKAFSDLSLQEFFKLDSKIFKIHIYEATKMIEKIKEILIDYNDVNILDVANEILTLSAEEIVMDGLKNLDIYNSKPTLYLDKCKYLKTNDICSLFYYHNKLTNYDLEQYF